LAARESQFGYRLVIITYLLTYLLTEIELKAMLCCKKLGFVGLNSHLGAWVASTPKIYRLALFDRPVIYDSCGLERVSKNFEP